ncbi:MAG TPA: L,D-transpeptidase [Pyrinomonadaceae bacterium]
MRKFLGTGGASLLLLTIALSFAACVSEPTTTTNTTTTNTATTATPAAATTPTPSGNAQSQLPVTLPVLDAMFADEAFAGELKSKLQLTDEQVARLRTIAREETASLREGEGDAHSGTTSSATSRAAEKIREVIGQEKSQQFTAFVGTRWATGGESEGGNGASATDAAATSNKPNSVPTDTRIVVNAPAYRMDVFENGQLVKSYKVGIGYPEFPLPTGQRKATTIIFNPTWTPPDEPWVESPSSKVKVGEKVPAGSKLNPLGPIKIPIGSPSLIHGGKSPARLGTFASHGCVGMTNQQVQDFSVVLAKIGGTELTKEDVLGYAKNPTETKNVKLTNAIPVELRYETIVVEDGKLRIFRDVYDHDTNTEQNLRATLEAHGVSFDQLSEQERAQVLKALKQMARDATGRPTDANAATPTPTPSPAKNANSKNANSNTGGERVTRNIKGQKEIVIEIAALRGKGYPAPVGIEGGGTQQKSAPAKSKRSA